MELLIAILIYIGVLHANVPYTMEHVHMLEMQHRAQVDEVRRSGFVDPNTTNGKTVWDHEEL